MKYRKKALTIEAIQYVGPASVESMRMLWGEAFDKVYTFTAGSGLLLIAGDGKNNLKVNRYDFVIRGIEGEFYPCKQSVFLTSYERA